MLFQHTLDLVLSGRKTQTSRLVTPDDSAERGSDGRIEAVKTGGRDKYRVGKTYAVQPARGKPAVARIRLLGIARKRVSDTTTAEAKAEGFVSREAFFETWRAIHGAGKLDAEVWLLTFELAEDA
jgi:hypothetical protein